MFYIVTALKSEAQAYVDRYKLNKFKLNDFTLYRNQNVILVISGIGVLNSNRATIMLINEFEVTNNDIFLNVGICAALQVYEIGELLEIGAVIYEEIIYEYADNKLRIVCLDTPASKSEYEIVDMESYGFLDAILHSSRVKKFHILKVVSDYFEPHKVTKEITKALIFNAIDDINKLILFKESQ